MGSKTRAGNFQVNSIYLLIRKTCWHTTMLHKMKIDHVQHVFILFEQLHVSTCIRVHISEVNYVYNL